MFLGSSKKKPVALKKSELRKTVKEEYHKLTQNKITAPSIIRSNRIFNILNDNTLQCLSLMPDIGQGDGQGERIANRVRTMKATLYLSGHVFGITNSANYDPPKYVDIYIYKNRKSNNATAIELNNFLQYGSTSIPYDSLTVPECGGIRVNEDKFMLKKHIRKVLHNPTSAQTNVGARNLMPAFAFKLDITKYLKKNLMYDDAVSNVVLNDNLFLSVAYTNVDDTGYANDLSIGEYDMSFTYEYENA